MRPDRRNLRLLVAASAMSNLGDGVFQVALPLAALGITRDAGAFASVTVVGRLPWLLFALPAGALADRLDRRRTMVLVDLGRAALIGLLAAFVLADADRLGVLYAVAFALGVGETLFDTAAQSILPRVVDDADRLAVANGRLAAVELVANQFVGPPLGAVVAAASLAAAFAASSLAYLLAGITLLALVGVFRPSHTGPPTRLRADIVEGVRYLAGHRQLRALAVCVGVSNLALTAATAVFPLYAVDPGPMHLSRAGYGLLLTTIAVGSVIGSGVVHRLERRLGTRRALALSAASFPVFALGPAVSHSAVWVGAAFLVGGVFTVAWNVITVSLRQRIVPDRMLGRVNAGYRLLAWGTIPIGAALGGLGADRFGLRATFLGAAAVSALCLPIALVGTSRPSERQGGGDAPADRLLAPVEMHLLPGDVDPAR